MDDSIDLKNPHRPIRVGVILTNSQTELIDIAPIDVFNGLSKETVRMIPKGLLTEELIEQALDVEYHWVSETRDERKITAGAVVKPTHSFEDCPQLDIALMGAHDFGYEMTKGEIDFIKRTYEGCAAFLFVCGGFFVALQAGLLEGKTATGPRPIVEGLKMSNPEVNWVTKRWAHDGKVWTSGTLLNGMDMVRNFVSETWGGEGSFVEWSMRFGGYPFRDVDYKDVPWEL